METKVCPRCGIEKPVAGFGKDKYTKSCLNVYCKECCICRVKKWRDANPEKDKESSRKRRDANIYYSRKYRDENPDYYRKYRESNKDKIKYYGSKVTNSMPDFYIKKNLRNKGFSPDEITPELIETQRLIIKIKRLVK